MSVGVSTWMRAAGWIWVAISITVLLVFGTIRVVEMQRVPPPTDAFGVRYVDHPVLALIHFIPGLVFIVCAPLQFVPAIRRERISIHRANGRMLVVLAAISGLFALVVAFALPAFGGLLTQVATVVFGTLFLGALWRAVWHIRRKEVSGHREWMIRVFAIGLAVATIRGVVALAQLFTGLTMEEVFGASFWIGLSLNAAVAEWWIRQTRDSAR